MANAYRDCKAALAAIEADTKTGKRTQEQSRRFLNSTAAKLAAAQNVLGRNADHDAVRTLASLVDPWGAAEEVVPYYFKRKRNGGVRPICILPDRLKCIHKMVQALLQAQFLTPHNFFGGMGKGKDAAILAAQALHHRGLKNLATLDIRNCFSSVNPESLNNQPLPKEVIRRHFDTRNLHFVLRRASLEHEATPMGTKVEDDTPSGPRGLIQGSPASNIILSRLLRGVPQTEDEQVILYVDNLLVAAREPAGLRAMIDTLAEYFQTLPGSPLELCEPTFPSLGYIDFLGYRLDDGGEIGLGDDAFTRLSRRLEKAWLTDGAARSMFPVATWRTIRNFAGGYPALTNASRDLQDVVNNAAVGLHWIKEPFVYALHQKILDPKGTPANAAINAILRDA